MHWYQFFFMIVLPVIQQLTTLKLVLMINSVYYANCENWCNEKIRHENDNCIVAYTYLLKNKTNKCQKNLLALYVHVGFKNKWTTGFYSKYPATTEGNLPIRVLKYKCQMQLKMHSDRSGSQNLEFGFFGSPMELRVYGKLNKGFSKKIGKNLCWFFYTFF